jgi:Mce-associated membrane protein
VSPTTPNWYDVLDVDPTATTDEVRDAWRAAIADLTPADRRFRLYTQAAEVLLDPERRAAHDAELARQEAEEADEVAAVPEPAAPLAPPAAADPPPASDPSATPAPGRAGWTVSPLLLAVVAVLAVLAVAATAYLWSQPSEEAVSEATTGARNAAERAAVAVLSYDHETLEEDREAAHAVMTSGYRREKYDPLFAVIEDNAPRTGTAVDVDVVASSIARVDDDGERVQVLLFLDRPTTNKANRKPVVYQDQATVTMQRVDGKWLVDDLRTSPAAP